MSICQKLTLAPSRSAFLRATRKASSEMSMASTWASGCIRASVMAMQPLPVPMSRMEDGRGDGRGATSPSVSGLGISTAGITSNSRPQKGARPMAYCTGSPCSIRLTTVSRRSASAADNALRPPQRASAHDSPKAVSIIILPTACASRSSAMAARSRLFISWYVISAAKVRISERKDNKKQIFFAFSGFSERKYLI